MFALYCTKATSTEILKLLKPENRFYTENKNYAIYGYVFDSLSLISNSTINHNSQIPATQAHRQDFVPISNSDLYATAMLLASYQTQSTQNISPSQEDMSHHDYLIGDTDVLSHFAKESVAQVSGEIYKKTGFKLIIHVLKEVPILDSNIKAKINNMQDSLSESEKFKVRRDYEEKFLSKIHDNYAVIFLFYNDHHITLKSNVDFLNTASLLDEYAYPYLPVADIYSDKYKNGVNEGLSNVYLATAHAIAAHYNVILNAPKPMEKPSEATRFVIYIMLFSLIGLFVLVYFGFFKTKKDNHAE
ncbi:hypothetical protein CQA44_08870 [Helicobacter sp. MIT 14-3879]|nr:hypothetical protein CQA44_08870 [Helicobacter sp. MIT 14-3879]